MSEALLTEQNPRFPDLLRSWRKLRKLSQWDLSVSAGISQRHLSFLESGRSSPSREMVIKLATSLDIPLQERNSLLGSAGFAPVYQEAPLEELESYADVSEFDPADTSAPSMPFLSMDLESPDFSISLFSMVSTFGNPHDVTLQQLKIETFFPADEESETNIRALSLH